MEYIKKHWKVLLIALVGIIIVIGSGIFIYDYLFTPTQYYDGPIEPSNY